MSEGTFEDGDPFKDPAWQKATKPRRSSRHIGCPMPWFLWVLSRIRDNYGKNQLAMALYLYRRCYICNSDTVTVPNSEVEEFGISRWVKSRTLASLQQAGVLWITENGRRVVKVRLCSWPDPPPSR